MSIKEAYQRKCAYQFTVCRLQLQMQLHVDYHHVLNVNYANRKSNGNWIKVYSQSDSEEGDVGQEK